MKRNLPKPLDLARLEALARIVPQPDRIPDLTSSGMHPQTQPLQPAQPLKFRISSVTQRPVRGCDARVEAPDHAGRREDLDFGAAHALRDGGRDIPQRLRGLVGVADEEGEGGLLAQHGDKLGVELAVHEDDACGSGLVEKTPRADEQFGEDGVELAE